MQRELFCLRIDAMQDGCFGSPCLPEEILTKTAVRRMVALGPRQKAVRAPAPGPPFSTPCLRISTLEDDREVSDEPILWLLDHALAWFPPIMIHHTR